MKRQHVLAGVLFACATAAAASKTMTANGDWATAANWSPTGVPVAGDTVTIDGRTVSITGGSGYSLNGLTVSGTGPAVSLSEKVYFANNENAFSWTQTGGSFSADVDEFELGKSGSGNRNMTFYGTDVTFLHRVILGRTSTADKCVYSQHGGTLSIDTTTGTNNKGFFIGTGSGGAALSLSNVTMTVDGGFTVANGTARCVVDIDKSGVTFNNNLMLGNPNDSKAEFRIRNSTLTLGGDLMTGTTTKSRQQTYAQISNCTVNVVGSHTISVGSGINSTSRIEVVESVWPAPDALALSIGATTGAVGAFRFQDMNQPLPAAWAGFDTSAGADGTLELVNAPSTFSGNVIIGGSSDTSQTLLLAGGRYDLGLSCDIGEKGNGRLVLNDATLSVGANVYSAIQSKTVSNPAKGELLMTNATLDVQRQLILGYNEMDFTTHAVVDADSRIYVTNRSENSGIMQVARYGNADLDLYGTLETVNLYIGNLSNAVGTVTVNTGATLTVLNVLVLGFTGCGDATLGGPVGTINQKGGTVNVSGGRFLLGGNNDSFRDTLGIYRLSGGELTSTAVLQLGKNGEGRFLLEGGTVTVPQVTTQTATGTGTIWFDGGVLKVKDGSHPNDFVQAGVAMKVCDGGAIVHSDYDVTIPAAFAHDDGAEAPAKDGGIVKKGAGTLTVTSTPTFTGDVRVEAGTLNLSGTSFTLGADAVIGGGGTLVPPSGGLTVTGAFTLDPTNAPTLTVSGPVTIGAGATVSVTDASLLNPKMSYRLYTATATSGAPELVGFPRGWMAVNDGTSLRVLYASGTTIVIR